MARRFNSYRIQRGDDLGNPDFWNKILEDVDVRIAANEDASRVIEDTAARVEQVALDRVNNVVTPLAQEAQQRLTQVATIFEATSDTEVTIGEGIRQFIIPEGKRLTFAPLAYLVAFPTGDLSKYVAGRTVSYDPSNGVLIVDVMRAVGEGSFSDWQLAPMAFVSELESLAQAATDAANATAADRIAVAADKGTAVAAKDTAVTAKSAAEAARDSAQGHLATFLQVYRGALAADPEDGAEGHFYFNTSQQMAKVYSASGWGPLFSLSLGGIRQGEIEATAGQADFDVGEFTFMNVWLDGQKLSAGTDFALATPTVTLTNPATAGQRFSYLGYYATDETDFHTKAAADAKFLHKAATLFGPENFDAQLQTGIYDRNDGTGPLIVMARDGGRVTQLAINASGLITARHYEGGVWSDWNSAINARDVRQAMYGGVTPVPTEATLSGTVRLEPGDGPYRYGTRTAAFTLAAPLTNGGYDLLITNSGTTGSITFSGFTVSSDVGDALTTTSGHRFLVQVRRINGISTYYVKALQG